MRMGIQQRYNLIILYNGSLMEKYLFENGFPVWDKHRPELVVWLAVRDGSNEYVLKDADESLLKVAANDALTRRGIPVCWPLYDVEDRDILSIAEIRGGFKEPVIDASKRYSQWACFDGQHYLGW